MTARPDFTQYGSAAQAAANSTKLKIPTPHADQHRAMALKARFRVVRCGRRWGKTALGVIAATSYAANGLYVGWFAPEYKFIAEAYRDIDTILDPIKVSASKDGVYTVRTNGRIDFWSLENENAGRSRKYHLVVIDEAAFTKPGAISIWNKSIRPTLLDYRGQALVLSNTNGIEPDNLMWQLCNQPEHGFVGYHAPTHANPFLPKDELAKLEKENHPLVYQQEYLAEFVDWSGAAFFSRDKLLVNGEPVALPARCDCVYAVIDSAVKTKTENDGTGVTYFAKTKYGAVHPLVIVDWDVQQIEGALLETWLPTVFQNLNALAVKCGARMGSIGVFIEDKASGSILIQQAQRRNWPARPIDSKLTAVGKDERAISVSGYVYQEQVKICAEAYNKVTNYKGVSRNHLLGQVVGFRIGDKDSKREDDLLDTFCYGIAIALGDEEGY